jgi:4-diphosphocytidyl-2C-methyl-D-erythritol kinase
VAAWDSVTRIAANAFSRVVARRHPEIDRYLGVLGALGGCRIAQLTGSGSALFGVFDRDPDLAPLAALEGCRAIRTDTVGRVAQVEVID